jgi:hypothetical protein
MSRLTPTVALCVVSCCVAFLVGCPKPQREATPLPG